MIKDVIDALNAYSANAILHREETEAGNPEQANQADDRIISAYRVLHQTKEGRDAIRALLEDSDPGVRTWAATHALEYAESEALAQLDLIASGVGPIAFNAAVVAQLWRAGELNLAK